MELRILTTDKNISLYGRYTMKNGLPAFDWPNSGMSFRFRGNAISVCFTPFDTVEPVYVRVTVDGEPRRFCLTSGQERIIVEGLQNRVHDFELLKVSESPFRICPSKKHTADDTAVKTKYAASSRARGLSSFRRCAEKSSSFFAIFIDFPHLFFVLLYF